MNGAVLRLVPGRRQESASNPFADPAVHNFVAISPTLGDDLVSTLETINRGGFLRLRDLVGPDTVINAERLHCNADKSLHLQQLALFMIASGVPRRVRDSLALVLDELLTNALFHAPVVEGRRPFAELPRSSAVESPRGITVQYAASSTLAGVAVRDEYGSLTPEQVVENLRRCCETREADLVNRQVGAGLGIHMVMHNANRLVFNIKAGKFTEVIAVRQLAQSGRTFAESAATLNLFSQQADAPFEFERRHPRIPVSWPAVYRAANEARTGVVRDVSVKGAFIKVAEGASAPAIGDPVYVLLNRKDGGKHLEARAVVRWAGQSNIHDCHGFGMEFEQEMPDLAA